MDGIVNTVVGYTGNPNPPEKPPTYENVCFGRGWVEAVRVSYDDATIAYPELLDAFFEAQEPKLGSRQYASIIFPASDDEQKLAEAWLEENQDRVRNDGVPASFTIIEKPTRFFKAEEYHQEYWQKTRPRIAGMVVLLAISTGILDDILPADVLSSVHSTANAIVLAGLLFVLAERKLDTKTVEL